MLVCKKLLLPFAFACCGSLFAQNIQNPVLPGVADAGVMKYNGKYYIGGVRTTGISMYPMTWFIGGNLSMSYPWTMTGPEAAEPEMTRFMPMTCSI